MKLCVCEFDLILDGKGVPATKDDVGDVGHEDEFEPRELDMSLNEFELLILSFSDCRAF
jgi:hypothetical protein